MNALVHNFPAAPKKPEQQKKRTITLTNRAPVTIVEDQWPIKAEFSWGDESKETPWGWGIKMKIRRHVKADDTNWPAWKTSEIIYAVYEVRDEVFEENLDHNQTVRVGRLLNNEKRTADGYWKVIRDVGEELRERIMIDGLKKYVTIVVDGVLANLTPRDVI